MTPSEPQKRTVTLIHVIGSTDRERMRAAREVARWKLGDPNWADTILHAYWNPAEATTKLREEENR